MGSVIGLRLHRFSRPIRSVLAESAFLTALLRTLAAPLTAPPTAALLALATLCNLVLDFAPMKRALVDMGFVPVLLRVAETPGLLQQVLWVLKNALLHCDSPVRTQIVAMMTYPRLLSWLEHPDVLVATQSFGIVRNLLHSDAEHTIAGVLMKVQTHSSVTNNFSSSFSCCLQLTGPSIARVIALRMAATTPAELLTQALYIVCNISNGPAAQKSVVLESLPVLVGLMNALENPSSTVRSAATWALYNLSQMDRGAPDTRAISRLKELNFHTRLQLLQAKDSSLEVLDRVSSLKWVTVTEADDA
jgi:armadillo repeat-containing protein 8